MSYTHVRRHCGHLETLESPDGLRLRQYQEWSQAQGAERCAGCTARMAQRQAQPRSSGLEARYAGRCIVCGAEYPVGAEIAGLRLNGRQQWGHAPCVETAARTGDLNAMGDERS